MSEYESSDRTFLNPPGFCVLPGCTAASVASRRVLLATGEDLEIEVCAKHSEGPLDLLDIEALSG
jgi:hypothetical protein